MIVRTHELVKVYETGGETVHALDGVSIGVSQGQFVAIMGASGSGKSTFMNMIGCLDVPTSGSIEIAGRDVAGLSRDELAEVRNRQLGFVFQQFNLLKRTSATQNVALPLIYAGVSVSERRARAEAQLADVGLGDRLQNMPNQLSGGQQQRVAIARALVTRPSILLADEPTGALDSKTSVEVMKILQGLSEKGISIILVTHEDDIAAYAERRIDFRDGRVIADEPVRNRR
ncbi:ABC transporter ATP-binding protein [Pacificimonas pallii]|nr:ABC transporter ATP-binding protein [Pacificimonas pallii]